MKPVHTMPVPKPRPNSGINSPVVSEETRKFVNQIFTELQAAFPAWRQTLSRRQIASNGQGYLDESFDGIQYH